MKPLKIIFMGTPDFAAPTLKGLIGGPHQVIAVYTQPPRPKGRGQHVQRSPVHDVASAHDIPVFTPKSLRRDETAQSAFAAHNADVAVVAAYGLLLPPAVLAAPVYGCLNVHASLLPRWRGAAPIQYAIWAGDNESGISLMQMEEGLDTGPVIATRAVPIRNSTTAQNLHDELAIAGAALAAEVVDRLAVNTVLPSVPQVGALATHAPVLRRDDGLIDWRQAADRIDCQIRALNPWPGTRTSTAGARIKILQADIAIRQFDAVPGQCIDRDGHVACGGNTALRLRRVQPDNAKAMDFAAAINGGYLSPGEFFT